MCLGSCCTAASKSSTALGRSPSWSRRSPSSKGWGWSRRGFSSSKWYPYKEEEPGETGSQKEQSQMEPLWSSGNEMTTKSGKRRRGSGGPPQRDLEKCWQSLHVTKQTVRNHSEVIPRRAHTATLLPEAGKPGKL